jgi:hypothetical protein
MYEGEVAGFARHFWDVIDCSGWAGSIGGESLT